MYYVHRHICCTYLNMYFCIYSSFNLRLYINAEYKCTLLYVCMEPNKRGKYVGPWASHSPELEDHNQGNNKLPADYELVWDLLHHLDAHMSMGPKDFSSTVLKELADVTEKLLSIIF